MAAVTSIPLYVGYDWVIPVTLTDTTTGLPLDISTWTLAGDFWVPFKPLNEAVTLPAEDVDVPSASFRFVVPRAVTSLIDTSMPGLARCPCRILVTYTDADQRCIALRPIFILPLDPRTSLQ